MTLPASGTLAASQVNVELGKAAGATINMSDTVVRTLFGKSSGPISWSDGRGKSNSFFFDLLVVAGGGAGGWDIDYTGGDVVGGGGGGGVCEQSGRAGLPGTTYSVTVGAGGSASGFSGSNSVFDNVTAIGGGYGGSNGTGADSGGNGGSGGGHGAYGTNGITTQGNSGGATGYGFSANSTSGAGAGGASGAGRLNTITGASIYYANGGVGFGSGNSGAANTGNGGDGGLNAGGSGGSGVVIVRYPNTNPTAVSTTGSPGYTNTGGYHIYRFTASGSIRFL